MEDLIEQVDHIKDEVELICPDLLALLVGEDLTAETDLVTELIVRIQDEDKSEYCPNQPPNIRE